MVPKGVTRVFLLKNNLWNELFSHMIEISFIGSIPRQVYSYWEYNLHAVFSSLIQLNVGFIQYTIANVIGTNNDDLWTNNIV